MLPKTEVIVNNIELTDEFDRDEISNKIINRTIIKADVAGAGKTSAFIYNAIKRGENTLIITPYNALCLKLTNDFRELENEGKVSKDQLKSITINKLMGLAFDGNKNTDIKAFNVDGTKS